MEIKDLSKVNLSECLTIGEYVKVVKERTGIASLSNQTIHYNTKPDSKNDVLDWIIFCGMKLIIQNEKAANFEPVESKKTRFVSTQSFTK